VDALKNKKYNQSLKFIQQAKQWPENLGVGKPYDADIDVRLEDWLAYLNYKALKSVKANEMLDLIIKNSDEVTSTDKYFTNADITARTFKQLNKDEEGKDWLRKESANYPDKNIAAWVISPDINSLPASIGDKEKMNADIINYLKGN
jgi:hypothetical protein